MDLGTFFIDKLIVHDVPEHVGTASIDDIVFSEVASSLTPDLRTFFRKKMIESLSRHQYEVGREPGHSSPVPGLIAKIIEDEANVVSASQDIAKHLFTSQTGVNPAGLAVVCRGKVDGHVGVGILKLEREDAIRVEHTGPAGARTFNIAHLRDLMLGKNTRLFKAALFLAPGADSDALDGVVSDDQRGYDPHSEIAQFFLNKFLGCRMKDQADVATKAFFETSQDWVNTVPDEPQRARYEVALHAYMNTPSKEISLKEFADGYLDVDDRTPYREFLEEKKAPTAKVVKDTGLVDSLIRQMTLAMADSKIRIVGTHDAIDKNVSVNPDGNDDPKVIVAGRLGGVRGGGR
jgi:hypothetical protein